MSSKQKLIFTNRVGEALIEIVAKERPSSVHVVTDANVAALVLPELGLPPTWHTIVVEPGDEHKNLSSLSGIWEALVSQGATRRSLVVNIGGGVVTDMGGFAAATFKRGLRMVNVPTTLLAAVDAAVGGKTGINFAGFKNEIGAFAPADYVVISTVTFATLPREELLSGYAEMLKHGVLDGTDAYRRLLSNDPAEASGDELLALLRENVGVKERIVEADPFERGLRRALNFGHTAGHAFEELALEEGRPVAHGYAVAWGMLVEMILSHLALGLPSELLHTYASRIKALGYGAPDITCDHYDRLIALMRHDKKNSTPDAINFTLLRAPGEVETDHTASADTIKTALDIFRDLMQ